ncbi:MAG: hypothetical protein EHM28_14180 [Spirochaetaceae bacterium]|nr:MAG: hypothetical protein EHM28_14180 [Spirochaetaceae bacterium]
MKVGLLSGIRTISIQETPKPEITKPNEVLLKVLAVGVCGSDIHYFKDGRIGSAIVKFPFRIGHEFSGEVVQTGKGVRKLKIGDRVAIDPAIFCGKCDQCLQGRFNTCRTLTFMGSPGLADGCLAEYVVVPQESCFASKKLTAEQLCLVEPLSIGVYAAKYALPFERKTPEGKSLGKKTVGILGAGPIGLSTLLAVKAFGAGNVYITDKIDFRVETARKSGAIWAGNSIKDDIVDEVSKREPQLLDVVFECAGEQETLDQACELLKPGGSLVIVGIHAVGRISFSADVLRRREITIYSVRRQNESTYDALKLLESGKVNADFMATHRFPMAEARKAYETVADYRDNVLKALIIL